MFQYDASKKYQLTNDMTDIENYIGGRVPMLLSRFKSGMVDTNGLTEQEIISKVVKFLWFMCIFENTWRSKGANDCRTMPIRNGEFVFTALKGDTVLKQTTLIL
jgi:hypothetical protein